MHACVVAVSAGAHHTFSKPVRPRIRLLTGLGVEGDAHMGTTVKHRSRVAQDPTRPNLRQVHLIHTELFDSLADAGYTLTPGQLGENITTRGLDLLGLSTGTLLNVGTSVIEVTGLRNPCTQIDAFAPGLLKHLAHRDEQGAIVRRGGVMGVVRAGGTVEPGMAVHVRPPRAPHVPLDRV
ncbi:MOSC domain-containing protein [Nocardiopsis sp. NRRL B-16309]|uniref:MOSC domain-containing protein n=1 Tax=Nocardiopsis sp. NRRL B-16309 TaxID=1519494 RepID=UPI0006B06028|nr:MOSC domain-containing protein [Nocardiopsis sp. NRRL B-16309]KOX15752.1 molybdenum cofactor biosysynthesis protein [Nocardiopsis sp. NRRL B-16309]